MKNYEKLPDFLKEESKACPVWEEFNIVRQIPRPSKKEDKIKDYIIKIANENNLKYIIDKVGNVVVKIPANNNSSQTLAIQAHLDMVCEKNPEIDFNFDEDSIELVRDGNLLKANGTTLGADNGIGVAIMLALIKNKNISHSNLELVFTVDEEQGLGGVLNFEKGKLEAINMINLDSEEDTTFTIGSAGGIEVIAEKLKYENAKNSNQFYELKIHGLHGGHSGVEIHKYKIGNSIVLLGEVLTSICDSGFQILKLNSGTANNAIPRDASIVFSSKVGFDELNKKISDKVNKLSLIYNGLKFSLEKVKKQDKILSNQESLNIVNLILSIHSGIYSQSYEVKGLIQTSANLGILKIENDKFYTEILIRSFNENEQIGIFDKLNFILKHQRFKLKNGSFFTSWEPNESALLDTAKQVYEDSYEKSPEIIAIHAGLECGVFKEKYPNLNIISIGPSIHKVHSPQEYVEIDSVNKFWVFFEKLIGRL